MAERTITVCDVCGAPATTSVTIRAGGRSLSKDVCATHLQEIVRNARPARRGRPRSASLVTAGTRPARAARRRASAKSAATAPAKRPRKRITDPETLRKRRAAMAKARAALAAKRAAAKKAR